MAEVREAAHQKSWFVNIVIGRTAYRTRAGGGMPREILGDEF
jgi:hypothetical protein